MIRSSILVLAVLAAVTAPVRTQGGKSNQGKETPPPPAPGPAPAPAQTRTPEQEAAERRREEIKKRIQTYRALERQGEVVRTHVQVRVKLRNEEMMIGVVRDGLFVERPDGLEFSRAEMTQAGAGLRLWFYNNVDGYIFIPYAQIEAYRILKRLSDVEVTEIRDQILERQKESEQQAAERRRQLDQKGKDLKEGLDTEQKLAELAEKVELDAKAKEEEQRLMALLQEFPPSEGWGDKKIADLNHRRIAIKVYPNEQEKRFIDNFADWKKAFAMQEERKAALAKKEKDIKRELDDVNSPVLDVPQSRKDEVKKDDGKPEAPREEAKPTPPPAEPEKRNEPEEKKGGEGEGK